MAGQTDPDRPVARRAVIAGALTGAGAAAAYALTRRDTFRLYCGTLPALGEPQDLPTATHGFVFAPDHAPTPSCHAASLCALDGTLLCAWFGGSAEGADDTRIFVSRRAAGAWSPPRAVADGTGTGQAAWNPVLAAAGDGTAHLFFKIGADPATWRGHIMRVDARGEVVAPARALPDGIVGPAKNKPLALPDGRLLCPSSREDGRWRVRFEATDRDAIAWEASSAVASVSEIIQPALLDHGAGLLQALCRNRDGKIAETWSSDGGRNWSPAQATALPSNNSGLDAQTLRDGRHLLVYNPTSLCRSPLVAALSDDGRSWRAVAHLDGGRREYSYPSIAQSADGLVHVAYTWRRSAIALATLDPAAL